MEKRKTFLVELVYLPRSVLELPESIVNDRLQKDGPQAKQCIGKYSILLNQIKNILGNSYLRFPMTGKFIQQYKIITNLHFRGVTWVPAVQTRKAGEDKCWRVNVARSQLDLTSLPSRPWKEVSGKLSSATNRDRPFSTVQLQRWVQGRSPGVHSLMRDGTARDCSLASRG